MAKGKGKRAAAKEAPPEEELEDLVEDDEEATTSTKRGKDEVEFGVADLCAYIKEKTGKEYSTRDMRTLLRKMAREDKARINREVIPGNRGRYDWPGGPKNPEVKAVLAAVKAGEIEEGRKAALEELKAKKAKKDAATVTKTKKGKAKPAPEPDEDEDEDFDVDFEDDDE